MDRRFLAVGGLIVALLCATALAVTPRLHERVHKVDPQHECLVTLFAAGNCEHATCPEILSEAQQVELMQPPLARFAVFPQHAPSSILEHAPPTFS